MESEQPQNDFVSLSDHLNVRLPCEFGFAQTLLGKQRAEPARPKCLTGDEEARIIATRLGKPPQGYANWSLRLLADKVVELQIAPKVSHETIRQTLKKTG